VLYLPIKGKELKIRSCLCRLPSAINVMLNLANVFIVRAVNGKAACYVIACFFLAQTSTVNAVFFYCLLHGFFLGMVQSGKADLSIVLPACFVKLVP